MRVVLPAPETPMRQVRTPGRKQPLMSVSSTSCGRALPSTASPFASKPCMYSQPLSSFKGGARPDWNTGLGSFHASAEHAYKQVRQL